MIYNHTQRGKFMLIIFFFIIILFSIVLFLNGYDLVLLSIMLVIIFIIISFSSLTVSIDSNNLFIKFGFGLFKRNFLISDIDSVKVVKNKWYYGWGIRFWFVPKFMIIYNVSGFDAIELIMKNGKIYRIGTDEPEKLKDILFDLI